jgi:trigger factor
MSTDTAPEAQDEKLALDVKVSEKGACVRHFVVTIPRPDIDKQFQASFNEIAPQAELPGFRVGKAPRKLLESRFRKQVSERVKSTLVMMALQQITEGSDVSAISEPDMDYGAVDLPDNGDFTFEFTLEVRPEFETPKWEGLEITKPTFKLTDKIIDEQMVRTLSRFADGEAVDGAAELGDKLILRATFRLNGQTIGEMDEEAVILREKVSFADCVVSDFGTVMAGVKEGDARTATATISDSSPNEALRGQSVEIEFYVVSISRIDPKNLSKSLLDSFGFKSVDELRDFVREELTTQQDFQQQQSIRNQVTQALLKDSNWEMPNSLVDRQTNRELQRRVLELRRNGTSDDEIKIAVNAMRRNARDLTVQALREHFMLEKIAEELKIEPTAEEYDTEIEAIAAQSDVSVRKMRANLERTGQMDAIRNQIIERQVIAKIAEAGTIKEVEDNTFLKAAPNESAIDIYVAPPATDLPVAKYDERPADEQKDSSTVKLER